MSEFVEFVPPEVQTRRERMHALREQLVSLNTERLRLEHATDPDAHRRRAEVQAARVVVLGRVAAELRAAIAEQQ